MGAPASLVRWRAAAGDLLLGSSCHGCGAAAWTLCDGCRADLAAQAARPTRPEPCPAGFPRDVDGRLVRRPGPGTGQRPQGTGGPRADAGARRTAGPRGAGAAPRRTARRPGVRRGRFWSGRSAGRESPGRCCSCPCRRRAGRCASVASTPGWRWRGRRPVGCPGRGPDRSWSRPDGSPTRAGSGRRSGSRTWPARSGCGAVRSGRRGCSRGADGGRRRRRRDQRRQPRRRRSGLCGRAA